MDKVFNKKLFNFLLFSYFGFESVESIQGNEEKCAYRAYLDLARTIRYIYSSSDIEKSKSDQKNKDEIDSFKEERKKLINDICKDIVASIKKFSCEKPDFNTWHETMCKTIKSRMNSCYTYDNTEKCFLEKEFTIGQAQKWLNMTLKYMWLFGILPITIKEDLLHAPIDGFILEALFNKIEEVRYSDNTYKYNGETWSAISDYNNYKKLQYKIRKIVESSESKEKTRIEWESAAWIEIAKERSNK